MGRPNIVTDTGVMDIKTTSSFTKMSDDSILQVLCNFLLLKANGRNIRYAGIILPMQRDVLLFDLEDWDYKPFLQFMTSSLCRKDHISEKIVDKNNLMFIGSHISTLNGIPKSIKNYIEDKIITRHVPPSDQNPNGVVSIVPPIQIMLRQYHINSGVTMPDREIALIRDLVDSYKLRLFIHSPFTINLSSKDKWSLGILGADLKLGTQLGCSGVVVHVGTAGESSEEEATDEMYTGIRQMLKFATEQCPLLLETPFSIALHQRNENY
jgi:hypothetical protein